MKTIFFVVNKNWEIESVLNALTQREFRPVALPYPSELHSPQLDGYRGMEPRAVYELPKEAAVKVQAVVWCVQDLMDCVQSDSSSEEKFRVLPSIYREYPKVNLVMAAGTAASVATEISLNASVLVGSRFFVHDSGAWDPNTTSHLALPEFEQVVDGGTSPALFGLLATMFQIAPTASRLLPVVNLTPPDANNPVHPLPQVLVDAGSVSLGTINVVNHEVYDAADKATVDTFTTQQPQGACVCVETTHGLIRHTAPAGVPVLFISGIANRVYRYKQEATPLHRYTAAFNVGVCAGRCAGGPGGKYG